MMLSLACVSIESVGLPSVLMWGDRGEVRCCGLSKAGMVEMVGICQVLWFMMLKSAKDRVLGVETPGQQVPPCVQYGTVVLLIRGDVGCVPCSDQWELAWLVTQAHTVKEGMWYRVYPGKP
jgi:hypothetical protein